MLRKFPLLYSIIIVISVIIVSKLIYKGVSEFVEFDKQAKLLYKTIIFFLIISGLYLLILKEKLPFKFFSFNIKESKYYLPLVLYVIVFSSGFSGLKGLDLSDVNLDYITIFTLRVFSSAMFEEFLFRGFVLGLFLRHFPKTKNGIFKSVALSGLLFGLVHIVNLWGEEEMMLESVIKQIYGACCLGIMYGATYLKTGSLLVLGIIHFLTNFASSIGNISPIPDETESIIASTVAEQTVTNLILGELLLLFFYGLPALIGIYIIYHADINDLNKLYLESSTKYKQAI